jgi:hypothetical protein
VLRCCCAAVLRFIELLELLEFIEFAEFTQCYELRVTSYGLRVMKNTVGSRQWAVGTKD